MVDQKIIPYTILVLNVAFFCLVFQLNVGEYSRRGLNLKRAASSRAPETGFWDDAAGAEGPWYVRDKYQERRADPMVAQHNILAADSVHAPQKATREAQLPKGQGNVTGKIVLQGSEESQTKDKLEASRKQTLFETLRNRSRSARSTPKRPGISVVGPHKPKSIRSRQPDQTAHEQLQSNQSSLDEIRLPGPDLKEQLQAARIAVTQSDYSLSKDTSGFCYLQDFELEGPLLPSGFLYQGFLAFSGTERFPSSWHREKFHMLTNSKVAYIIPPKSWSTSTQSLLKWVGTAAKDRFVLDFSIQTWWKERTNRRSSLSFLSWFNQTHGAKHLFSTIREPYERLDAGIGTMLNRERYTRGKEAMAKQYQDGLWFRTAHHIYPQSYFYTHLPQKMAVFRCGPSLQDRLKAWLQQIYPAVDMRRMFLRKDNAAEGPRNGLNISLTNHLIRTGNRRFLRDYAFDQLLWEQATELHC